MLKNKFDEFLCWFANLLAILNIFCSFVVYTQITQIANKVRSAILNYKLLFRVFPALVAIIFGFVYKNLVVI